MPKERPSLRTLPLAIVDLETTGLRPTEHEILEIGVVRVEQTGDRAHPLKELERFDLQVAPEHIERADPAALKVCRYHERDWSRALPFGEAAEILTQKIAGHIFFAQNVAFDHGFLDEAFARVGRDFGSVIHYHKLDLASFAYGMFYDDPTLQRFTLRELTEKARVKNADAHTALSDAVAAFQALETFLTRP